VHEAPGRRVPRGPRGRAKGPKGGGEAARREGWARGEGEEGARGSQSVRRGLQPEKGWEGDVGNNPGPTRAMRGEWGPQFGRGGLEGRAGGESRRGGVRGRYCTEARASRLVGWWW
jgi:hypothetical protein